jgi:hypothetical protein
MLNKPEISRLVAVGIKLIPIDFNETKRFYDALNKAATELDLPQFARTRLDAIRQAIQDENAAIEAARLAQ